MTAILLARGLFRLKSTFLWSKPIFGGCRASTVGVESDLVRGDLGASSWKISDETVHGNVTGNMGKFART